MNEILAQIYGTNGATTEEPIEKTAEAALLDELEKVAAAEGIDLGELSDDDIVEILNEAMNADAEKTAADETVETAEVADDNDDAQVKLAEADFLGRAMAHAFYNELSQIGTEVEKTAAEIDPSEQAAMARAEEILAAATEKVESAKKTAAPEETPKDRLVRLMGDTTEKQASDDEAITARALEILDANDYDVEKIVELLA